MRVARYGIFRVFLDGGVGRLLFFHLLVGSQANRQRLLAGHEPESRMISQDQREVFATMFQPIVMDILSASTQLTGRRTFFATSLA
jgi:hypothetical protein